MVTGVAIYGAAATSWSLAKDVYHLIKDIHDFNDDLKSLRDQYTDNEQKLDLMIVSFQEIRQYVKMEFNEFIDTISQRLNEKLLAAKKKLEKYRRLEWPFVKRTVASAIEALSEWVGRFEARYALLPPDLQKEFQDHVVNDKYKSEHDGPLAALHTHIAMRAAQQKARTEDPGNILKTIAAEPPDQEMQHIYHFRYPKDIILIPKHIRNDPVQLRSFAIEVGRLTAVLKAANQKLTHLPKAHSWFQQTVVGNEQPYAYGIAYQVRDDVIKQYSLKDVIKMGTPRHTLTDRMKLTVQFVSAMAYVRGLEWVHKAIKSSNILLCYNMNDGRPPAKLGFVNLVGYHVARRGTGEVVTNSNDNERHWRDEIYCHPDRQTITMAAEDIRDAKSSPMSDTKTPLPLVKQGLPYYRYVHDVYSIGVVLLEIGLWQDLEVVAPDLQTAEPQQRQQRLLGLARDHLPVTVGKKYASIVNDCLEASDDGPGVSEVLSKLVQIQI